MAHHFIVVNNFSHQVDCFCTGEVHSEFITFKQGDVIEVTNDRKFTMAGWYFLLLINNHYPYYIAIDDLEKYNKHEQILSIVDIELKINYLQFQINQALDTNNKVTFLDYTPKLKDLNNLKRQYNNFMSRTELPSFF